MQGNATGNLISNVSAQISYETFLSGEAFNGRAGVLVDENGGLSEPLAMPSTNSSREGLLTAVDNCPGAVTKEKGIFRKREVAVACPALGSLAMINPYIKDILTQQSAIKTVGLSALRKPTQG